MIILEWSDFKKFVDDKKITFQWFEKNNTYLCYASDGLLTFECNIDKDPSDTTDLSDFETNYKDLQNISSPQVVTPTSIKNEYILNPEGMHATRYTPVEYQGTITLSNKSGATYDYIKTLLTGLSIDDAIWYFDSDGVFKRTYISSYTLTTVTLEDEIPNGVYNHSRVIKLEYQLDSNIPIHYLWACCFSSVTPGRYDWAGLEVYDPQTDEFLWRYDECWATHLNRLTRIGSPDGAAGELPAVKLVIEYYHADDSFTGNILLGDYVMTYKDE